MAEADAATGDTAGAIALWDGVLPRRARARAGLCAHARRTARGPASRRGGLARVRRGGAGWPGARGARPKAAIYLRGQNDPSGAAFIETESSKARRALGFDESGQRVGPGDPTRVGLALPLSGKFQPIGEAALRAAMLALGSVADCAGHRARGRGRPGIAAGHSRHRDRSRAGGARGDGADPRGGGDRHRRQRRETRGGGCAQRGDPGRDPAADARPTSRRARSAPASS